MFHLGVIELEHWAKNELVVILIGIKCNNYRENEKCSSETRTWKNLR